MRSSGAQNDVCTNPQSGKNETASRSHYFCSLLVRAAELLTSLPTQSDLPSPSDTEVDSPLSDDPFPAIPGLVSRNQNLQEARLEADEAHKYLLAKTYFECREFDRCAAVFLPATIPKGQMSETTTNTTSQSHFLKGKQKVGSSIPGPARNGSGSVNYGHLSQKSLFLALYAKYLSGEKRKNEDSEMVLGPSDGGATLNKELVGLGHALEARLRLQEERGEEGQGWLEYLYGIVLIKLRNDTEAKKQLIRSVHLYPWNWGAWQELGSLISSADDLNEIGTCLPRNLMAFIFHIFANQELFQVGDEIFHQLKTIRAVFPTSTFLRTQKALLHYHAKDFEKAESTFSNIVQQDPHRLDNLDTYSNILYVMEKRAKLAFLAQLSSAIDKFRPETCCVVGNYYAMKSEHEKAVVYFRRALTLDRTFLSAWTLMGHEYVEMKNTQAAIECYRRAVDVNRRDYRAWYGLGQTYEVLEMHFYALHYYRRAASLSPYDPKMWGAVGSCLAKMGQATQAIKAYKRALVAGSYYDAGSASFGSARSGTSQSALLDPDILFGIACMYDKLGNDDERKAYLELVLAQEEGIDPATEAYDDDITAMSRSMTSNAGDRPAVGIGVTATTSKARLWLCKIAMAEGGVENLQRATELANELCQDGWEVEEAKGLARQIRSMMLEET